MADIYTDLAVMNVGLLKPAAQGGFGQGVIQVRKTTVVQPSPSTPWLPPITQTETETINGVVRGVDKRLVGSELGGTVLLMSDRVAFCTPPKMAYTAGDELLVDGVPVHIISYEKVPAAGITVGVRFIIRG